MYVPILWRQNGRRSQPVGAMAESTTWLLQESVSFWRSRSLFSLEWSIGGNWSGSSVVCLKEMQLWRYSFVGRGSVRWFDFYIKKLELKYHSIFYTIISLSMSKNNVNIDICMFRYNICGINNGYKKNCWYDRRCARAGTTWPRSKLTKGQKVYCASLFIRKNG